MLSRLAWLYGVRVRGDNTSAASQSRIIVFHDLLFSGSSQALIAPKEGLPDAHWRIILFLAQTSSDHVLRLIHELLTADTSSRAFERSYVALVAFERIVHHLRHPEEPPPFPWTNLARPTGAAVKNMAAIEDSKSGEFAPPLSDEAAQMLGLWPHIKHVRVALAGTVALADSLVGRHFSSCFQAHLGVRIAVRGILMLCVGCFFCFC